MKDEIGHEILEVLFESWDKTLKKELFNTLASSRNEIENLIIKWKTLPANDKLRMEKEPKLKKKIEALLFKINQTETELKQIW